MSERSADMFRAMRLFDNRVRLEDLGPLPWTTRCESFSSTETETMSAGKPDMPPAATLDNTLPVIEFDGDRVHVRP